MEPWIFLQNQRQHPELHGPGLLPSSHFPTCFCLPTLPTGASTDNWALVVPAASGLAPHICSHPNNSGAVGHMKQSIHGMQVSLDGAGSWNTTGSLLQLTQKSPCSPGSSSEGHPLSSSATLKIHLIDTSQLQGSQAMQWEHSWGCSAAWDLMSPWVFCTPGTSTWLVVTL